MGVNTTMTNQDIFSKDETYVAHTYNRFPVAVQSGHGATAKDFDGKEYIDFGSMISLLFIKDIILCRKKQSHEKNLLYS